MGVIDDLNVNIDRVEVKSKLLEKGGVWFFISIIILFVLFVVSVPANMISVFSLVIMSL